MAVDKFSAPVTEQEFNDWINQHERMIYSIARKISLPQGFDIDDLYQEAVLILWRDRETYRGDKNATFKTWAYLVMKHAMYNFVRRVRWEKWRKESEWIPGHQQITIEAVGPDQREVDPYPEIDLLMEIDELLPHHQFVLRAQAMGYSLREIGEMLGKSTQAVTSYKTYALGKLGIGHLAEYMKEPQRVRDDTLKKKQCAECRVTKPIHNFYIVKGYRRSRCNNCISESNRERYLALKG